MTAALPPDVRAIIASKLASGEFTSEADVLAAGVRLLQQGEEVERARSNRQTARHAPGGDRRD